MAYDERTPLLQFPGSGFFGNSLTPPVPPRTRNATDGELGDLHHQFCHLVGLRPANQAPGQPFKPNPESLYSRASKHKRNQNATYIFTATLTNTLLMSQVVLGAALTGLGASDSSRVLITVFGALNTVIAGLIAFLKSRGQPMRARMFRDDLERVVDEIENSATMWLGISRGAHGYDAIDTDEQVTVRSEVARLTRLYDRAVKTNTMNDPDTYAAGGPNDPHSAALRSRPLDAGPAPTSSAPNQAEIVSPAPGAPATDSAAPVATDPDESPATKPKHENKDKQDDADEPADGIDKQPGSKKDDTNSKSDPPTPPSVPSGSATVPASSATPPTPTPAPTPLDEDASPASAAHPPESSKNSSDAGKTDGPNGDK